MGLGLKPSLRVQGFNREAIRFRIQGLELRSGVRDWGLRIRDSGLRVKDSKFGGPERIESCISDWVFFLGTPFSAF